MTAFQEKVYAAVKKIPRGETASYKDIARAIGKPGAFRAVGTALAHNTDPQIPCHRVIKSDGSLGRYNGIMGRKEVLLKKEGAI